MWEASGLPSSGAALDMRVTNAEGQVLVIPEAIPAKAKEGEYPTGAQFDQLSA